MKILSRIAYVHPRNNGTNWLHILEGIAQIADGLIILLSLGFLGGALTFRVLTAKLRAHGREKVIQ